MAHEASSSPESIRFIGWVSAAVLDAQQRFRRIRGHKDMHRLIAALERIGQEETIATDQQVA